MTASPDRNAQSIGLIIGMAVCTSMLRLGIVLANTLVLWRVYGRAKVLKERLEITRIKPDLVVSNGDVLRGLAFQHYLVGAAVWLVSSLLAMLILYHFLLPPGLKRTLKERRTNTPGIIGTVWAFALFVLVVALLPLSAALTLALFSVICAVSWAWRDAPSSQRTSQL